MTAMKIHCGTSLYLAIILECGSLRTVFVFVLMSFQIAFDDLINVLLSEIKTYGIRNFSSICVNVVIVDWQVSSPLVVTVVESQNNEEANKHANHHVHVGVKRESEWQPVAHNIPIEGRNWVQSKPQHRTGDDSKVEVVWLDPSHPVEVGKGLE
ncbi:hypothetical protein OGATHE_003287 [Ogataea polymorpha]|uniref:Uncharacterized protein n=1 Tax=Ogataea polymorpha TaxID=460523 RepID=A0A9P8P3F1_9ASCO|nr:hypothetical protein OGATHE_003287 [Ogataea polymorpha]